MGCQRSGSRLTFRFAQLYEIEREVKDLDADERRRIRQARGRLDRR